MARRRPPGRALTLLLALVWVAGAGCASTSRPRVALDTLPPPPASSTSTVPLVTTTTAPPIPTYTVAEAKGAKVAVYGAPTDAQPARSLPSPQDDGSTLVFLVKAERGDWVNVSLPVRPNGSTGWIKASDVNLTSHNFRIEVKVGAHHITVYKGNDVFLEDTVAVGAPSTPTALGSFYTTGAFATGATQPVYGPYAYPLSGYSEVLFSFGGGEGQMGLHGTNDPSSLGRSVSNGCVRLSNASITKLHDVLPDFGVPVDIEA